MKDDASLSITGCRRGLALITLLGLALTASDARGFTRYWLGTAGNANWSDPNNWSPTGAPQNGEDLVFTNRVSTYITNNLVGLSVRSLSFGLGFAVVGNTLTITDGIDYHGPDLVMAMNNAGLVLGGNIYVTALSANTGLTLNCPINLNGFELVARSFNGGGVDFRNAIFGNGSFANGAGTNSLAPFQVSNNLTGPVRVLAGELVLAGQSGYAVTSSLEIDSGAAVVLTGDNQTFGSVPVTIVGGGQLLLNGHYDTIGSLVLTNFSGDTAPSTVDTGAGELGLNGGLASWNDSGSAVPIIKGWVNLNGFVPFTIGGSAYAGLDLAAGLGSAGGFSKAGNAALLLHGPSTFAGGVEVDQGILDVSHVSALGAASGGLLLAGGSLILRTSIFGESLTVNGHEQITGEFGGSLLTALGPSTLTWSGSVVLDTNLVVAGGDISLSGPISGTGGLVFLNTGTANLGGSTGNLYTGTTTVRCPLLEFSKPSGVNAYAGPLVVGGGAGSGPFEARWLNAYQNIGANLTLYANGVVNLNNNNEDFGPVTFNGGEVDTGVGQFAIYAPVTVNPAATSAIINGYLGLPPGDNRVFIVGDGAADCDLVVNAVVFGSPTGYYFVKQGAGTLCLANANTYNAVTLLEDGILDINSDSGLGTWPGLVIFGGATLRLSGSGNSTRGFEVVGAGVGGTHGAVEVQPSSSWTFSGGILLDSATTFNVGASGGLGLNGILSGNGPLTKTGSGALVLGGGANNTYSGDTMVSAGSLLLAKSANHISVPGNLIIGPAPAGPTAFTRYYQTGGLGGTTVTVNANSLFDINGYNQILTQLTLNDGGTVQTGNGTLSLADGSSVNVGSLSAFGAHAAASIFGRIELPVGSANFNVAPHASTPPLFLGPELELPAAISGGSSMYVTLFNKYGLGQMELGGNNTFFNQLRIYEGTVIATNGAAFGSASGATFVYNGAMVAFNCLVPGEYLVLDSTNVPALDSRGGGDGWNGTIYLNRPSSINVGSYLQINGVIDGPGSLTKLGPGPLIFGGSANNTYTGETFINAGNLTLLTPAGVNAVPGHVTIGTTNGSVAVLYQHASFNIVGSVTVNPGSLWDLSYGGGSAEGFSVAALQGRPAITLNGGSVSTGSGIVYLPTGGDVAGNPGTSSAIISGNVGLDAGIHHFTVGGGGNPPGLVVSAAIGQTGTAAAIEKDGPGVLRLTGASTCTGTGIVTAGTLQVDGSQPQSPVQVNGGILQGIGTVGNVSFTGISGIIAPGDSPGMLTCSNLDLGGGNGTLQVELNGTTPGSGYDQLNVRGTVNLAGVSLSASLGYASSVDDQFTIINNDGTDAVIGTFAGLPQGTNLYIGGQQFFISYTNGSGNDVVLTRLVTPPPPALAIQSLSPSSFVLAWATNDPSFTLQCSSNLTVNSWITVSPPPVIVGENFVFSNTPSGPQEYFRLVR